MSTTQTSVANPPTGWPRIAPHLIYDDPGGAIAWLTDAFGFSERTSDRQSTSEGIVERALIEVEEGLFTVGFPSVHADSPARGVSSMRKVYVDDVDAHYRRATAAGATIVLELEDQPWGDRRYQATDLEGHQWLFAQHISDTDWTPAASGGTDSGDERR